LYFIIASIPFPVFSAIAAIRTEGHNSVQCNLLKLYGCGLHHQLMIRFKMVCGSVFSSTQFSEIHFEVLERGENKFIIRSAIWLHQILLLYKNFDPIVF
jgi:hypothetical protein